MLLMNALKCKSCRNIGRWQEYDGPTYDFINVKIKMVALNGFTVIPFTDAAVKWA